MRITVSGSAAKVGKGYKIEAMTETHCLEHSSKRATQVLFQSDEEFDCAIPTLLWVGDLDRDGKPDLLIDLHRHYNVFLPTLFLSSEAGQGGILKQVASIRSVGC